MTDEQSESEEKVRFEISNAESLETALNNKDSSSEQHEDDIKNLAQQKSEPNILLPELTLRNNVKSEEASQAKVENNASSTEPAPLNTVKSERENQTKVENGASSTKPATQGNVRTDDSSQANVKNNASSTEPAHLNTVKSDRENQTKVESDVPTKEPGAPSEQNIEKSNETEDNVSAIPSVVTAARTKEEAEKEQKSSIVSAPTEGQPLSNPTEESLANPIPPTPDASKELNDVKELTSKLKTTMQTISLAKNSLIY